MSPTIARRLLAVSVAAALVWLQAAPGAVAAGTARFSGRVLAADGATPRAGVTVALVDEALGTVVRSEPTDDRGVFRFDSASPGSYTLVAESTEGAFVAPGKVVLEEGGNPAVALALQPTEPQEDDADKSEGQEGEADTEKTPPQAVPPPVEEDKGLSPVLKGVITGVVGLLAVAVIIQVSDEEDPGSPF